MTSPDPKNTGVILKPNYWGVGGQEPVFKNDILQFDKQKNLGIVKWSNHHGAWVIRDIKTGKFICLLYSAARMVTKIQKEFLNLYTNDPELLSSINSKK